MKKISKASELLWVLGTIFVALGVSLCSKANLGVSMIAAPAFIIAEAIPKFSVGVMEYIVQGILLIVLCIIIRRFRVKYLLAFAVAVIYGYVLDLFLFLLGDINIYATWLRWVTLLIGDCCVAFGVACFFRTYLPLQVYELFVSELSDKFKFNINKTKWVFDISLLIISVTLALTLFGDIGEFNIRTIGHSAFHNIGLGTFVTTLINSPIINFMGKIIDRCFEKTARFEKVETLLK